ncbi:MAG: penicillin-insensitive murein endopeptidase [Syntrophobacteraceae bacterium]|nr:penicillin-insensitive murein endopeptidase [Syntrophobacteraceae bacterium]
MKGAWSRRALSHALILLAAFTFSSLVFLKTCHALTASYGEPYNGYLVNGVVFPDMFPGYHVRNYDRAYTTPELAGALLDGIEAVKAQFPGTCDVFIGDFSKKGGGRFSDHASHENGRDVDVGLYAKDNTQLHNLIPMNRDNLDPEKTLFLIQNLVASQRVQYIFLDRSIQKVLYDYGLAHGYTQAYLNRLFGNVAGALVQDIPGHVTHMHIRFFTPWSTLASHIGADEDKMRSIIAVAQESYLPKKVDYYVTGGEKGVCQLAGSFGVSRGELCAWNHITPYSVLVPGSCLVFYKRSFESGAVQLASSLQPGYIAQAAAPPVRVASLEPESAPRAMSGPTDEEQQVSDQTSSERPVAKSHSLRAHESIRAERPNSVKPAAYYTVKHSGTLKDVARKTGISAVFLARLNRLPSNARVRSGARIKIAEAVSASSARRISRGRRSQPSRICFESESGKQGLTSAYYRVARRGTLKDIASKTGIPLSSLCRLNHLSRNSHLRRGQMIKLAQANLPVRPSLGRSSCSIKYPSRKTTGVRHVGHRAKLLKPAKVKSARKPVAITHPARRHGAISKQTAARHAKPAAAKKPVRSRLQAHRPSGKTEHKQSAHSRTKAKSASRRHGGSKLARR